MPSQSYRITEPHPSIPASHYINYGRGGLGNMTHIDPKAITSGATASGPASRANLTTTTSNIVGGPSSSSSTASTMGRTSSYYTAGRGGAGNMHQATHAFERPIFSFDEELERQRRMMQHMAPVYHIGRGGAGNLAPSGSDAGSSSSLSLSRRSSSGSDSSSDQSALGGVGGAVRNSLEDRWHRLRDSFAK